jgi:hypothetical protein
MKGVVVGASTRCFSRVTITIAPFGTAWSSGTAVRGPVAAKVPAGFGAPPVATHAS